MFVEKMTTAPKVSVIVAIYKAEAYLGKCIESLQKQTLDSFEVLLIDDGSPDKSGEIADRYAAEDSRLRVFHKPNEGVSATRQFGLDHAQGEYIIHCDPDDWVEPTMLAELWEKAKAEDADMVICDFYQCSEEGTSYHHQKPTTLDRSQVIWDMIHMNLLGVTWNKLTRRKCFSKYHVTFPPDLSYCEDLYVNCMLLRNPMRIAYLPKSFYHYRTSINSNSISGTYTESTFDYGVHLLSRFKDSFKESEFFSDIVGVRSNMLIRRAFHSNYFSSSAFRKHCYKYRSYVGYCTSTFYTALYYCACIGCYRPAYGVWYSFHCLNKLKRKILRDLSRIVH